VEVDEVEAAEGRLYESQYLPTARVTAPTMAVVRHQLPAQQSTSQIMPIAAIRISLSPSVKRMADAVLRTIINIIVSSSKERRN